MTDTFRAHASPYGGRRTWWVEIHPAYQHPDHGFWTDDLNSVRVVGIDTGLPMESRTNTAHLKAATAAAEDALNLAGWRTYTMDGWTDGWASGTGPGDRVRFVERIQPSSGDSAYPAPEDGFLRRDGGQWISSTPRISRHPSPAYVTAGAAWRLARRGLALPEGYTREVLKRVTYLTSSHTAEGVIVSDRQARELGEIARVLAEEHADDLELSDFGDEAWGVAAVLRALETGRS